MIPFYFIVFLLLQSKLIVLLYVQYKSQKYWIFTIVKNPYTCNTRGVTHLKAGRSAPKKAHCQFKISVMTEGWELQCLSPWASPHGLSFLGSISSLTISLERDALTPSLRSHIALSLPLFLMDEGLNLRNTIILLYLLFCY